MAAESYQAAYDVLSITRRLEGAMDGVTRAELHLLAYLACLLAIYRRLPASEWGYGFIRSQWGAPFATEIEKAFAILARGGFLSLRGEVVFTTGDGQQFVEFLATGEEHRWRTGYLDGACASALAMPVGTIREALRQEPSLRRASVHRQPRVLLAAGEDAALYGQFVVLAEALGTEVRDLMVPSVVWLGYLQEKHRLEMERPAAMITRPGEADRRE